MLFFTTVATSMLEYSTLLRSTTLLATTVATKVATVVVIVVATRVD